MQKKYERIVAWVQQEIESGALSRGDKLPSENDLMDILHLTAGSVTPFRLLKSPDSPSN